MTTQKKTRIKTYADFISYLTTDVTLVSVALQNLQLAAVANTLLQAANLVSLYKTRSNPSELSESATSVLTLQSPLLCYPAKSSTLDQQRFDVFGGVMTYQRLLTSSLPQAQKIPVLLIPDIPAEKFLRLYCLHDFTRMFLHDAHNTELKTVQGYLEAWFKKPQAALSIFQSDDWLTLYPQLNSKAKVAKWLNATNKVFTHSDD